ncbi:hydroxymethylbilane synthase [Leptobacterium sp. I13]|uniref:hydroxymethylbilane synthase n=1 Tax=Leptobacterium meishanense TaxID=3128904 RepID=UPI0030ED1BBD
MQMRTIRIGTRDSELALWQANTVKNKLEELGYTTQLVAVKSTGDIVLDKPLYELGITGIFTKTLDVALLKDEIDIAVHSMKDVPTSLPKGLEQVAVLKRGKVEDILVYKGDMAFIEGKGIIATGSLRRKAQWLHRFPRHKVTDIRGNVNTRLQKLKNNNWDGAIFAQAGLERINLKPKKHIILDWMIPAPAQGAMVVVAKQEDVFSRSVLTELNHEETEMCTYIERQFLRELEGGCTAPIGAIAKIENGQIHFKGILLSIDGKQRLIKETVVEIASYKDIGKQCAQKVLESGGKELMKTIKGQL